MANNPLEVFERLDPELLKLVENNREVALSDGALPKKFKILIAMALDASKGTVQGVNSLAQAAMQAGATKEEIAETVRVVQFICGAGGVYTSAHALKELF